MQDFEDIIRILIGSSIISVDDLKKYYFCVYKIDTDLNSKVVSSQVIDTRKHFRFAHIETYPNGNIPINVYIGSMVHYDTYENKTVTFGGHYQV